jgi:heme/copper-type cytochrome/quinol oxidase subunit 2
MNGLRRALGVAATFSSLPSWAAPAHDALSPAGPQAAHIHALWTAMLAVCTIVFVAILLALGLVLWRTPRAGASTLRISAFMQGASARCSVPLRPRLACR